MLIVIRPEPGCAATLAAARTAGLEAQGFPLFAIEQKPWAVPDAAGFDGLLVGSANVFRKGGAGLEGLRHLPVHCVGETTAEAARAAGFTVAGCGRGGLQAVLDKIPAGTRLLRLAGEERVDLLPPEGVTMTERVVYASKPQAMPEALAQALQNGPVVLLHSAEAARHFAAECDRLGLPRETMALAALGPRIAAAAGRGWQACQSAESPNDTALLALAARMCQERAR